MTAPKVVSMDAATEAFLSGLGSIFTVAEEQDKRKEQFFLVFHSTTVFDLLHSRLVLVGGHSSQFRPGGKNQTGSPDCDGETLHPVTLQGSPPIFSAGSVPCSEHRVFCF